MAKQDWINNDHAGGSTRRIRKKPIFYEQREKDILLELINTLKVGGTTVKEVLKHRPETKLISNVPLNGLRMKIWAAVTSRWNKATGNNLSRKSVRELYNRIKFNEKAKQDEDPLQQDLASNFGNHEVFGTETATGDDGDCHALDTEIVDSDLVPGRPPKVANLTDGRKYQYILPKTTTTTQPNYQDENITINHKEVAATVLDEEALKQMKTLGKFKMAEAKLRLNINYMKTRLLESQLRDKGISFELPFPKVEIPSSDESSDEEEGNYTEYFHNNRIFRV